MEEETDISEPPWPATNGDCLSSAKRSSLMHQSADAADRAANRRKSVNPRKVVREGNGSSFLDNNANDYHSVYVNGAQTYWCQLCGKHFKLHAELSSHIATDHRSCSMEDFEYSDDEAKHQLTTSNNLEKELPLYEDAENGENGAEDGSSDDSMDQDQTGSSSKSGSPPNFDEENPAPSAIKRLLCDKSLEMADLLDERKPPLIDALNEDLLKPCNRQLKILTQIFYSGKLNNHRDDDTAAAKQLPFFECRFCKAPFTSFFELNVHQKDIHWSELDDKEKLFWIDTMEKSAKSEASAGSSSSQSLKDVNMANSGAERSDDLRLFVCETCSNRFKTRRDLKRHIAYAHDGNARVSCPLCNISFTTAYHMKRHIVSCHSNSKPFKCSHPDCNKAYSRKDKLKEHMKAHSSATSAGNFSFYCIQCSAGFATRDQLKEHENIHSGDNLLKCDMCEESFKRKVDLETHIMNHVLSEGPGESSPNSPGRKARPKPEVYFTCSHCQKKFSLETNLKRHVRTAHATNQSLWMCTTCLMSFESVLRGKKHIMNAHSRGRCTICNKVYSKMSHARRHITDVHGSAADPVKELPSATHFLKRGLITLSVDNLTKIFDESDVEKFADQNQDIDEEEEEEEDLDDDMEQDESNLSHAMNSNGSEAEDTPKKAVSIMG